MDGYHYSRAELDNFENPVSAHRYRGAPFTFNGNQFVNDLKIAKKNGHFAFPGFDHAAKDPTPNVHVLEKDCQVVLVEGNYLLLETEPWSALYDDHINIFDEMWYLKCELNELKSRLANRHMKAWGWTIEKAIERIVDSDEKNMVTVQTLSALNKATKVISV